MANAVQRATAALVLRDAGHAADVIADLLHVSVSQVYRYLNGEVTPKLDPSRTAVDELAALLEPQDLDDLGRFQATVARRLAAKFDRMSMSDKGADSVNVDRVAKGLVEIVEKIMDVSANDKEWLAGLLSVQEPRDD